MLTEADIGTTAFAMGEGNKADEKLHVTFMMHPHPDPEATAREKRPIFAEKEYIRIIVPGDKTTVVFRPVWEMDKQRFPRHYAQFKRGQTEQVVGTPLSIVPFLNKAQVEELAYFGIKTVEQLAAMPDSGSGAVPAFHTLKKQAAQFVEAASGNTKRVEDLEAQNRALMERLAALEASVNAKVEAPAKGK